MKSSINWKIRWRKLIDKTNIIHTQDSKQKLLLKICNPEKPEVLSFVNAHAMNLVADSESFFESIYTSDIILRDGSGVVILLNQLNILPGFNLNGTDLIPVLVKVFNGRSIALFGTETPYLEEGVNFVKRVLAPKSDFFYANGFLDNDDYMSLSNKFRPALIVLGMGMPRQEEVAIYLRSKIRHPCLIICGGAIIDFWGGKTSRAPLWMRENGIEWLYRLQMEPRRLFRRYVIGNIIFLFRVLILSISKRNFYRNYL